MPASRPYKYHKSTKNKTQNRRDLIYRTSLPIDICAKILNFVHICLISLQNCDILSIFVYLRKLDKFNTYI